MSSPALRDDVETAQLVARIAQMRDKDAFRALFEAYVPRLKTYLMRQGASADRAEDLAQEALLTVWRKAAYFDHTRANVSAWLFTIARNLRIDSLRREKSAVAYGLKVDTDAVDEATPEREHELADRETRVRAAIAELPREQLEVVQRSFFLDQAHAEIASDLGLPLGTVKSRLRLALAKLRGMIGDLS